MAYVYFHIRNDTNEIFYIGIGNNEKKFRRAHRTDCRNPIWKSIVNKTSYKVHIYKSGLSWEEAGNLERKLIEKYKRKKEGGTLCNLTLGGDGILGLKMTAWNKGKKVPPHLIRKGYKLGAEYAMNCSTRMKEYIKNNGHYFKNKKHSIQSREKMRNARLGKKQSEHQRLAIKNSRIRIKVGKYINDILIKEYESIKEASVDTGISKGTISCIVNGKIKTPRKYQYEIKRI